MHSRRYPLLIAALLFLAPALAACADLMDPEEPGNLVMPTVAEEPSLPRIAVGGTLLHAEAFGDPADPMVMVLHGGPGADYRSLLPLSALADDGLYVVFWDQRGAGLSQRHNASTIGFDVYRDDVRLVLEHYTSVPGQPVVFIGHSWGAMYATWFINEYGDYGGRIRGAVLSEPGAFTSEQLDRYMDDLMGTVNFLGEELNDAAWLQQIVSPAQHARADYMAMVMSSAVEGEHNDPRNPSPAWRAGAVVNRRLMDLADRYGFDWTTDLADYDRPVLFLRGELNEAMPLAHQQELAASYPNATILTIPDVGHEMIWERPVEYLAHVRAYLEQIGFAGGES